MSKKYRKTFEFPPEIHEVLMGIHQRGEVTQTDIASAGVLLVAQLVAAAEARGKSPYTAARIALGVAHSGKLMEIAGVDQL